MDKTYIFLQNPLILQVEVEATLHAILLLQRVKFLYSSLQAEEDLLALEALEEAAITVQEEEAAVLFS